MFWGGAAQEGVLPGGVRDEAAERHALGVGARAHAARPRAQPHRRRRAGAARPPRHRARQHLAPLQRVSFLNGVKYRIIFINT